VDAEQQGVWLLGLGVSGIDGDEASGVAVVAVAVGRRAHLTPCQRTPCRLTPRDRLPLCCLSRDMARWLRPKGSPALCLQEPLQAGERVGGRCAEPAAPAH
jgi:hypothetical protein